jgi:Fe-S oxidoreductase
MARMKIEVQAARAKVQGFSLRDRFIGWLPRYAPYAAGVPWLMNLRDTMPGAAQISELVLGLSARRRLPQWRRDFFRDPSGPLGVANGPEVILFVDTFNRYFEPETIDAAIAVLTAAGYRIRLARPHDGDARPLCCGRTFLAVGAVEEARAEADRTLAAFGEHLERGVPVVGLEPSCVLGFRDEFLAMIKGEAARRLATQSFTFEEFLLREAAAGRLKLPLKPLAARALLHGHCHQKAFDAFGAVEQVLKLVPELAVETIESSCCGMAGSFGYGAETIDVSLAMGELSLLPVVRKAPAEAIIVADGTSCRQQIRDGSGREALHVARVLARSLQ